MTRTGRPSEYCMETASMICGMIAEGHSLVSICRDVEGMPNRVTVARWLDKHEEFRIMYARARDEQADAFFDEIKETIDQEPATVHTEYGSHVDSGEVQHRRLKVDALKWMASKLRPKKYGDLTQVQGEVAHRYVAHIPQRTTNDPAEWAKRVQAERVASGELVLPAPEAAPATVEAVVEPAPPVADPPAILPPPTLPQRNGNGRH